MQKTQYLIIGAGHAGVVAAMAARARDPDGTILMIGEEDTLPYERPGLSKSVLAGDKSPDALQICDHEKLAQLGIKTILGITVDDVSAKSCRVRLNDGTVWQYQKLLFATGSRVRPLPVPGAGLKGVHYLRTKSDAIALRDTLMHTTNLIVVGAGFVGLEVAATAREAFGCNVTVVEAGPEVLQRAAPERLRGALREMHEARGVTFVLKTGVAGFVNDEDHVAGVSLDDGQTIKADAVVIGIGALPNVEIARQAGLDTADGILTDAFGKTSDENIWAAGEVARHVFGACGALVRHESWQMAQMQAALVGANMAGAADEISYVPWFWTDQYGVNYQLLGRTGPDLNVAVRTYEAPTSSTVIYLDGDAVVGALCINAGKDIAPIRKAITAGLSGKIARLSDASINLKSAFH